MCRGQKEERNAGEEKERTGDDGLEEWKRN